MVALDALTVFGSLSAVTVLHHEGAANREQWLELLLFLPLAALVVVTAGSLFGLYGSVWAHAGIAEARALVLSGPPPSPSSSRSPTSTTGGSPAPSSSLPW